VADTRYRYRSETLPIRIESGKLLTPADIGSQIHNMYFTAEGTLRTVWGPAPYVPNYGAGYPAYNEMHGIYHTTMWGGTRDVLLIQTGDEVWIFEGWTTGGGGITPWRVLIGPGASNPDQPAQIDSDRRPRFPAQFETTPAGVVIIPRGEGSRPYFYDGQAVLPLGYDHSPEPPEGWSKDAGYDHTAGTLATALDPTAAGPGIALDQIPRGRLGMISTDGVQVDDTTDTGRILEGTYRCSVQWIDRWGNLSPLSSPSGELRVTASHTAHDITAAGLLQFARVECQLPEVMWTGIPEGPTGTIGRVLCRTKDLKNSGTTKMFELPPNAGGGTQAFSTLPDNVTVSFPDNIPDSWLIREPDEPEAVVPFLLYKVAFGRGWAANFTDDPSRLQYTMPGRWGTFLKENRIYPDPSGGEITGMFTAPEGLLVFTESSTFLIVISYGGEGFQTNTLSRTAGCVAPSSLAALPDGRIIWLGQEGFYAYTPAEGGGSIGVISEPIERELRSINRARRLQATAAFDVKEAKYRCWVPHDASIQNNRCWEYDGEGWTRRTDTLAADVCTTKDHRNYMLAAGRATEAGPIARDGVWVLDHEVRSFAPASRPSRVVTSWLRGLRAAAQRGSPVTVYLWFREMSSGTLNVEVQRDWRSDVTQTASVFLHPQDDFPAFLGPTDAAAADYGGVDPDGDPLTWERRRPYWTRADIHVPSAEAFRLRITHTGDWEFIGMSFDEVPHPDSFRSAPK